MGAARVTVQVAKLHSAQAAAKGTSGEGLGTPAEGKPICQNWKCGT